jgi:RNA polymerase sigma-70 factor (ECF subfamily)
MTGASQLALASSMQSTEFADEAALLAACRRHDVRAFEQLYRAHGPRLKSIAWHTLGNRQDAEDAVQEAFLKVYRGIGGFAGDSAIGTWLYRIVINFCYDLQRKRRREGSPEEALAEERPAAASQALSLLLRDALRRIHPQHRMVFLLFEVEGLRHAEIAAALEVPEGTSKAWLFEAKKELKRLLTEARR